MSTFYDNFRSLAGISSHVRYAWLGQCGYCCQYMGKTILIDPMLNDCLDSEGNTCRHYPSPVEASDFGCNFYFATHGHIDHFAPETAKKIYIRNPECKFVLPSGVVSVARSIGISDSNIISVEPDGKEIMLDEGISVCAVSASHPKHIYESGNPDMAVSYILTLGNKKIIHIGDGYLTESLKNSLRTHKKPDLLLPPINGRECEVTMGFIGNMNAAEAFELAKFLEAKLTLPTHFDMFKGNTADPLKLVELVNNDSLKIKSFVPEITKIYEL